jgi:hypothetical protein
MNSVVCLTAHSEPELCIRLGKLRRKNQRGRQATPGKRKVLALARRGELGSLRSRGHCGRARGRFRARGRPEPHGLCFPGLREPGGPKASQGGERGPPVERSRSRAATVREEYHKLRPPRGVTPPPTPVGVGGVGGVRGRSFQFLGPRRIVRRSACVIVCSLVQAGKSCRPRAAEFGRPPEAVHRCRRRELVPAASQK